MALELLEDLVLTKGLKQAIPFLTGIVEANANLTNKAILDIARTAGLSFRDSVAGRVVTQLKADFDIMSRFRLGSLDELPDLRDLITSKDPLSKNYAFLAQVTGTHPETGGRITRNFYITSDTLLTPAQVQSIALGLPGDDGQGYELMNATVNVTRGIKSRYA